MATTENIQSKGLSLPPAVQSSERLECDILSRIIFLRSRVVCVLFGLWVSLTVYPHLSTKDLPFNPEMFTKSREKFIPEMTFIFTLRFYSIYNKDEQ
jgi:hypothetical protein